ncbi:MAG: hypothetical protein RID53_11110 [Coleofasciculus sp. B1-GNL1-01]
MTNDNICYSCSKSGASTEMTINRNNCHVCTDLFLGASENFD